VADMPAHDPAVVEGLEDGAAQRGMRVPVEPGGVFAEEVDVLAAVEGGEPRALRLHERDREGLAEERRARVAARQHLGRLAMLLLAARVRVDETCPGGFERRG